MFSLIREVLNGFWDLCLSLNFVLDSGNALSPVASDADCPSADRSHVHDHEGTLLVDIVHTLVVDHAILFNMYLKTHSFWADELAFGFLFLRVLVCFESATVSSPSTFKTDETLTFKLKFKL